jgi:hypothetical protein
LGVKPFLNISLLFDKIQQKMSLFAEGARVLGAENTGVAQILPKQETSLPFSS